MVVDRDVLPTQNVLWCVHIELNLRQLWMIVKNEGGKELPYHV